MRATSNVLLGLALLMGLSAPACRNFNQEEEEKPKVDRRKVNLPETPPLEKKEIQTHTEDGAFTVAGILAEAGKHFGTEVRVRGIVVDKVECPVPEEPSEEGADAGAGETTEGEQQAERVVLTCHPPPHLFLTDDLAHPTQQILVTGTDPQIHAVTVARPVTLSGRLVKWSDDRVFVRTEGLIQLNVPEPTPTPTPASADSGASTP